MILEKEITIQINSSFLIPHYKKLGYNIKFKDTITIPIEHLPRGSHVEITAICSKCGKQKKMMYKTYNISTENNYMCITCSKEKKNRTMLDLYGHKHALQCDEFNKKKIDTWKANYGVDHPMKNKKVREKHIGTMIKLYGTEHALCNTKILHKMLSDQLEKYGMLYVQTDKFKEKSKDTNIDKYDVQHVQSNKKIRDKRNKTMQNRYGVLYSGQNPEILQKILKSSKKIHNYKNSDLYYQGSYENHFLELCEKLDILQNIKRGFSIKYELDNNTLIYFPDFFIEKLNMIIEIKSSYWYKVHEKRNIQKGIKCKELGYNYILIIDKDYTEFYKNLIKI